MRRIGIPMLFISVVLLVCFFAVTLTPRAQSPNNPNLTVVKPLVLYDNFNGPRIDPAKWDDWTSSQRMLEAVRQLSPSYQGEGNNGRLRMFQRAYSETYNDDGASYGWLGLQFTKPAFVTEIQFDMIVNNTTISACQSNPSQGSTWSGFVGRFFNYGGLQGSDQDVEAGIVLNSDSTDAGAPLSVLAHTSSADGAVSNQQTLGFVPRGRTARLRVKWDQPNHQFVFQLNGDPVVSMAYGLADTNPPNSPIKAFWVGRATPNCTTTPLGSEMIDTYFDNVYVNAN
jgi:hypothetical protein